MIIPFGVQGSQTSETEGVEKRVFDVQTTRLRLPRVLDSARWREDREESGYVLLQLSPGSSVVQE